MKRKISILLVLIMLVSMFSLNTPAASASSLSCEITSLPDRIALTDEPITITQFQSVDSDGEIETTNLTHCYFSDNYSSFEIKSPTNSNVADVTVNCTEKNDWGKSFVESITITPKNVGTVEFCLKDIFYYTATIYVYDPNMTTAEQDTPRNLQVKKFTPSKLNLSWDKVYGASEYMIYRSKTGKDGSFKKIKTTSEATYTDKKLTAGKTYYYKVKAVTPNGTSNFSDVKKCRVSRKLKISVDWHSKTGSSTRVRSFTITNKGASAFTVRQEIEYIAGRQFIDKALYYPYSKASYSSATLVNGKSQAITSVKINKGKSKGLTFILDEYRIPQSSEHISFDAAYDGVYYTIYLHKNGNSFYTYNNFGSDIKYNDDTIYKLK